MKVVGIRPTEAFLKSIPASKPSFKALEAALAQNSPLRNLFIELGIKKVKISVDFADTLNHAVIVRYLFVNSKNETLFERQIRKDFKELSFKKMFDYAEELILDYKGLISK